jgi:hypothetical protein
MIHSDGVARSLRFGQRLSCKVLRFKIHIYPSNIICPEHQSYDFGHSTV